MNILITIYTKHVLISKHLSLINKMQFHKVKSVIKKKFSDTTPDILFCLKTAGNSKKMESIVIWIIIMAGAIFVLSCVFVVGTFCREWAEMEKNRLYYPLVWLK